MWIFIADELSKNKCWIIIGKEAYKIASTIVVTLLATIGAAVVISTTQMNSSDILEKTTVKFNTQVPMNVNFTKAGKKIIYT